ncbi:40S ribosomal protein S27-like [Molossus molossus]|uniref:40S ribosomal protein S27-like n=1 Tax=Molossus molossus TaxID=27622 RepID=UPI00174767BB|nr:40S ribosomal protein S27-like [Molossus molossus]
MPLAKDLLNSSQKRRKGNTRRGVCSRALTRGPMKCPGCYKIFTVLGHAQRVVLCVSCSTILCQPTGGKARLTEGGFFRRKQH